MLNAQMRLLHPVQQETFPVETKCSLKQSPVSNFSKLSQFSHLIQPQGLVRATCRPGNSQFTSLMRNTKFYWTIVTPQNGCTENSSTNHFAIRVLTT